MLLHSRSIIYALVPRDHERLPPERKTARQSLRAKLKGITCCARHFPNNRLFLIDRLFWNQTTFTVSKLRESHRNTGRCLFTTQRTRGPENTEVDGRKEAGRWEGCGVATRVSSSVPTQWKTHYRGMGIDRWDVNGTVFVFNYPFLCGPRCILRAKHWHITRPASNSSYTPRPCCVYVHITKPGSYIHRKHEAASRAVYTGCPAPFACNFIPHSSKYIKKGVHTLLWLRFSVALICRAKVFILFPALVINAIVPLQYG